MNQRSIALYEYECDGCHNRFEVMMTFREHEPFDRDEQGNWRPTGYPELQPECPDCHSHDVVQVRANQVDDADQTSSPSENPSPSSSTECGRPGTSDAL